MLLLSPVGAGQGRGRTLPGFSGTFCRPSNREDRTTVSLRKGLFRSYPSPKLQNQSRWQPWQGLLYCLFDTFWRKRQPRQIPSECWPMPPHHRLPFEKEIYEMEDLLAKLESNTNGQL